MSRFNRLLLAKKTVVLFLGMSAAIFLAADSRAKDPLNKSSAANASQANVREVEMFSAMKKGDISVKLIPKDSTQSRVLIENKTKEPLTVKLPPSFGASPILAQGGINNNNNYNNNNNQNQNMGGGMGSMGGMGMGGGMFNVPPEKVVQFKVATVCLDHGKREPRASVPYEIKPLSEVTEKPGVEALCTMLGTGKVNQRAAQAAAWHLNNGMSWQELAAKQLRYANGTTSPYFSQQEVQAAMMLSQQAQKIEEQNKKSAPATQSTASMSH